MNNLKIPSSLRWIWFSGLVLLATMISYRTILVLLLASKWDFSKTFAVLGLGFLNDLGIVGFVCFLLIILGLIPALHPYKKRLGKRTTIGIFLFFGFLFALLNMMDLVFIRDFERRPVLNDFALIFQAGPEGIIFRKSFSLFYAGALLAILLWGWWLALKWLHKISGSFTRADDINSRKLWKGLTLSFCSIFIVFAFFQQKRIHPDGEIFPQTYPSSLSFNTVQMVFRR
jgi:hypothetical protein